MPQTKYLTTEKAALLAKILGHEISSHELRRQCALGRLGRRIGRNWTITESQLRKFLGEDRRARGRAAEK